MKFLKQYGIVLLGICVCVLLFWFRPGGVSGPEPAPRATAGKTFDHANFDKVLQAVVGDDGLVDYGKLKANTADLDTYLGELRAQSPRSQPQRFRTSEERLAYYLNAYNAFVLAAVRDRCPLDSTADAYLLNGFYWRISFWMGEEQVTLTKIADELIPEVSSGRPEVTFALVRGALGSAGLPQKAYRGETLDEDLQAAAKRAANTPRLARREGDQLLLSPIFHWTTIVDLKSYLAKLNPSLVSGTFTIEFLPFDQALNGSCQPR